MLMLLFDDAEAVNHVAGLFDIGDVHREFVAHLRIDPVRSETAADGRQLSPQPDCRCASRRYFPCPKPRSDLCFPLSDRLQPAGFR